MTKLEKMKIDIAKFHRSNSVDSGMNEMTAMYYGVLHGFDAADEYYRPIVEELVKALELIDKRLQIPAAEYVPAIGDVFQDIDAALESVREKI